MNNFLDAYDDDETKTQNLLSEITAYGTKIGKRRRLLWSDFKPLLEIDAHIFYVPDSIVLRWNENNVSKFAFGLNLYLTMLPSEIADYVNSYLLSIRFCDIPYDLMFKACSSLTAYVKLKRTNFGKYWRHLIDLGVLAGFQEYTPAETQKAGIDWINNVSSHKPAFGLTFEQITTNAMKRAIDPFWKPVPGLTINEMYQWPENWIRKGAANMKKKLLLPKNIHKTKALAASEMNPSDIIMAVESTQQCLNFVFAKRDKGKKRVIVGSSTEDLIRETPEIETAMKSLHGASVSTLFLNNKDKILKFVAMAKEVENPNITKVPIDQDKFDYHVTLGSLHDMMEYTINSLTHVATSNTYLTELRARSQTMIRCMTNQLVAIGNDRSIKLRHITGMLSGHKYTAIFDTFQSIGILHASADIIEIIANAIIFDRRNWCAQGDDIRVIAPNRNTALSLLYVMQILGVEVNPRKFFTAQSEDEFLRMNFITETDSLLSIHKIQQTSSIVGAPARIVCNMFDICEMDAVNTHMQKVRAIVSRITKGIRRGLSPRKSISTMISMIKHAIKDNPEKWVDWVFTPAVLGGLGFGFNGRTKIVDLTEKIPVNLGHYGVWTPAIDLATKISNRYANWLREKHIPNTMNWKDKVLPLQQKQGVYAMIRKHYTYRPNTQNIRSLIDNITTVHDNDVAFIDIDVPVFIRANYLEYLRQEDIQTLIQLLTPDKRKIYDAMVQSRNMLQADTWLRQKSYASLPEQVYLAQDVSSIIWNRINNILTSMFMVKHYVATDFIQLLIDAQLVHRIACRGLLINGVKILD